MSSGSSQECAHTRLPILLERRTALRRYLGGGIRGPMNGMRRSARTSHQSSTGSGAIRVALWPVRHSSQTSPLGDGENIVPNGAPPLFLANFLPHLAQTCSGTATPSQTVTPRTALRCAPCSTRVFGSGSIEAVSIEESLRLAIDHRASSWRAREIECEIHSTPRERDKTATWATLDGPRGEAQLIVWSSLEAEAEWYSHDGAHTGQSHHDRLSEDELGPLLDRLAAAIVGRSHGPR